jgi:hypothetical protein
MISKIPSAVKGLLLEWVKRVQCHIIAHSSIDTPIELPGPGGQPSSFALFNAQNSNLSRKHAVESKALARQIFTQGEA